MSNLTQNELIIDIEAEQTELMLEIEPHNIIEVSIENGARGKSTYEIWIDEGNIGTQADFLDSLRSGEHYVHNQILALEAWVIIHKLGKYPSVSVVDTSNNLVMGNVEYIDENSLIVRFTSEFSGKAFLN